VNSWLHHMGISCVSGTEVIVSLLQNAFLWSVDDLLVNRFIVHESLYWSLSLSFYIDVLVPSWGRKFARFQYYCFSLILLFVSYLVLYLSTIWDWGQSVVVADLLFSDQLKICSLIGLFLFRLFLFCIFPIWYGEISPVATLKKRTASSL
jgi:hypothetical protein